MRQIQFSLSLPSLFQSCMVVLLLVSFGLVACSEKQATTNDAAKSPVLARVNGAEITQADVDFSLERTFSQLDTMTIDAELKEKLLDSLIASQAMKQLVLQELSAEKLSQIQKLTKAYEEELYVKEYLQLNVSPEPVTTEMVQQYYNQHPEEFGGEVLRDFELLKAPANLKDNQRDLLLTKVSAIRTAKNWAASASQWQRELGLEFQQGRSKKGLLNPQLLRVLEELGTGTTSDVFFIDGAFHLVRVTNTQQVPAKSLAEVSGDIRKRLAPLMLKDAVKRAADEARSKVSVERVAP